MLMNGLQFITCPYNTHSSYEGSAVVLVPNNVALRQDLLNQVHDQNHFGALRTYTTAKRHFTLPDTKDDLRHFVNWCPTFLLQKPSTTTRLQPLFLKTKFYPHAIHAMVLDVVEGLPFIAKGHNGVQSIFDKFTKFVIYVPIHTF